MMHDGGAAMNLTTAGLVARVALLESQLRDSSTTIEQLTKERDLLRASHERLRLELELLKRRIFAAKSERVDTAQLEMEFAEKLAALDALAGKMEEAQDGAAPANAPDAPDGNGNGKPRAKPKGRRDLRNANIPEERVELTDPLFEKLVAEGKATKLGFEESCKLAWQRGGHRRLVIARTKYRALDQQGEAELETTPMPAEAHPRSLAAPSLLAHIAVEKFCYGLPLFRIEDRFAHDGVPVDRGTMCRWLEDVGATLGASVIAAARADALKNAFCIATDATGIAVLPSRGAEHKRQACRRGHYFVQIADKDHVFFEYAPRETSAAVLEMFRGYAGYVQADAKSVFDALFRTTHSDDDDDPGGRNEVGCWSHARRKFWEAAIAKDVVAREALARIGRLFDLEQKWKGLPAAKLKELRGKHSRTHLDAFFGWAAVEYERVKDQRGLLRSAFGYALRNQAALSRFFDDGRLELTNNGSERQLRRIAVGRKNWLFVGSDLHAESAGHLLSLIASARLHKLDTEAYLRDILRVLGHWPRERYLELAPKHWAATRARLDPAELAMEVGPLTIPHALAPAAEQETGSR